MSGAGAPASPPASQGPSANTTSAATGQGGLGRGLKNLKRMVTSVRTAAGGQTIVKKLAKQMEVTKFAVNAAKKTDERRRRGSVDIGRPDWPTLDDMCTNYEFPAESLDALTKLVDELHSVTTAANATSAAASPAASPATSFSSPTSLAAASGVVKSHNAQKAGRLRLTLPHGSDDAIESYPEEFKRHVRSCAAAVIIAYLLPQIRRRRHRLDRLHYMQQRMSNAPVAFSPDAIKNLEIFRSWPPEAVKRLALSSKMTSYLPGDVIVYYQEPSAGALVLANGVVASARPGVVNSSLLQSYAAARAKYPDKPSYVPPPGTPGVPEGTTFYHGAAVFGETTVVIDENWASSIIAITACDVFLVSKTDFARELTALPQPVIELTQRAVILRRNSELPLRCPFLAKHVVECGLLSCASNAFAEEVASRVEPACVRAGTVLVAEGRPANGMYFIRKGRVRIGKIINGDQTTVGYAPSPSVAGDTVMVANAPAFDNTVFAVVDVDAYFIPKSTFDALLRNYPADADAMTVALSRRKKEDLRRNMFRHRDLIDAVPLLKDLPLTSTDMKEFLLLLEPRTYRPLTSVCSTSSFCNRIIIVTKGKLRVGDHAFVPVGGCIGWSCTVPHRWGEGCMTVDTAEVLEASGHAYMQFLEERNWLKRVVAETMMVLFPKAHNISAVAEVQARLPPHVVSYPVSDSTKVNLNELRFCSVHMDELVKQQKLEASKRELKQLMTPPAFKPLTGGLWAPKASVGRRGFVVSRHTASPSRPASRGM